MVQLIKIQLVDVSMATNKGGVEGCNMLKETDKEVVIDVQTVIKDDINALPYVLVNINIPKLHGTLTDNVHSNAPFRKLKVCLGVYIDLVVLQ